MAKYVHTYFDFKVKLGFDDKQEKASMVTINFTCSLEIVGLFCYATFVAYERHKKAKNGS